MSRRMGWDEPAHGVAWAPGMLLRSAAWQELSFFDEAVLLGSCRPCVPACRCWTPGGLYTQKAD